MSCASFCYPGEWTEIILQRMKANANVWPLNDTIDQLEYSWDLCNNNVTVLSLNVSINMKTNLNWKYGIIQASSAHHVHINVTITRSEERALRSGLLT